MGSMFLFLNISTISIYGILLINIYDTGDHIICFIPNVNIKSNQLYFDTTYLKKINQGCLQYGKYLQGFRRGYAWRQETDTLSIA